jgi:hypothetical protein
MGIENKTNLGIIGTLPVTPTTSPKNRSESTQVIDTISEDAIENNGIPSGSFPADKTFWLLAIEKMTENLLSVKVWTIFAFMLVSAHLCFTGHLSGSDFATSNGSIISVVYALRESFKTIKLRQTNSLIDIKKVKV